MNNNTISTIIERHCRLCNTIKPHLYTEKIYDTYLLKGIEIYSKCNVCNITTTEIVADQYCPHCDKINSHCRQVDGYDDIPFCVCEVCNKGNQGFRSKEDWKSEELKRKKREYARRYREKKQKEIAEKYK